MSIQKLALIAGTIDELEELEYPKGEIVGDKIGFEFNAE